MSPVRFLRTFYYCAGCIYLSWKKEINTTVMYITSSGMEKKTVTKSIISKGPMEAIDCSSAAVPEEQSVLHKTNIVISAIKYLKKVIHRLSKDEMDTKNKQKLFLHYNDLVDVIIAHSKQIEIDKLTMETVMDV